MNKIIVLIPFYNELNNLSELKNLIRNLSKLEIYFKFVFCDDNSNDNTAVNLSNFLKHENFDFEIVENNTNLGHGGSLIRLSKYKQINDFDFVLTIDFDFSYMYLDLVSVLNSNLENSIVIGKRKFFDEGVFRQSITTCSELIIFMKSFKLFKDTNCPIRLYPSSVYLSIWKQIPDDTLIPNIFSTFIILKSKLSFRRVSINKNRQLKINSVSWGDGFFSKRIKIIYFSLKSFKQIISFTY